MLAALAASPCAFSGSASAQSVRNASALATGTVTGIIRDMDGVPQMGALVEAILPDASVVASAITDSRGRYSIHLHAGSYRIQASAALLLPGVRERTQLVSGGRRVVDLTLATLLTPSGWLPASRRVATEPGDDWMWTLRSSANRSILRLNEQNGTGTAEAGVAVSSSRRESRRDAAGGSFTVRDGAAGFAQGGSHQVLVLTRVDQKGSGTVLRADLSGSRSPYPVAPSSEISIGLQRRTVLNGYARAVLSYSGHPELTAGNNVLGMQGATLRSAERMEIGDLLRIDVGSVLRDSNFGGNAVAIEPFFNVAAHAPGGIILSYAMTKARGTETIEDLDRVQAAAPIAVLRKGHLRLQSGTHHAVSAAAKLPGQGIVEVAMYHDRFRNPTLNGSGTFKASEMPADGFIADPTTSTYRVGAEDYTSAGFRVAYRQPITHTLNAGVEVSTGQALKAGRVHHASLQELTTSVQPAQAYAGTAYVDGRILKTGTFVRSAYRWQPSRTLTAVDGFRTHEDSAYLSCSIRQSLAWLHGLPQGLQAVLDVQNLLAEGYQPFLSSDGRTLFLAQTPRSLQAGLSFTF